MPVDGSHGPAHRRNFGTIDATHNRKFSLSVEPSVGTHLSTTKSTNLLHHQQRKDVGRSSHAPNAQVHQEPTARAQADGRVSSTLRSTHHFDIRNSTLSGARRLPRTPSTSSSPAYHLKAIRTSANISCSKQRCPPPKPPKCLQGRAPWQAERALQGPEGPGLGLWLPNPVRWWQEHWLRSHLRQWRGDEDIRAALQACEIRNGEED